jgi:hypothetical protein
MAIYFFHLCEGEDRVVDEEGRELPDMQAALAAAVAAARDIMAGDVRIGILPLNISIEIVESETRACAEVQFEDAVQIIKR